MVNAPTVAGSLPRLKRALSFTAAGVRQTTSREALFQLAWRWLALVGALFVLDLLFGLPVWLRWVGLVGQGAFVVAYLVRFAARPVRGPVSPERAARLVEERHPEVDNALINAVQFERTVDNAAPEQASLMRREMERGEGAAAAMPLEDAVDRSGERRAVRLFLILVAGWVLLTVVFPSGVFAVMPRLFAPWMDDLTPPFSLTKYDIRPPGATVKYGDNLNVAIEVSGPIPESLALMTRTGNSEWRQIHLDSGEPSKYSANLSDLREDTWYFVAGGGSRSARYRVHVVRPPVLVGMKATYTYPAYTRMPQSTESVAEAGIHALAHSKVSLEVVSNRPLQGGSITLNVEGQTQQIEVKPDAKDSTHGRAEFALERPGTFTVGLVADDGQVNPEAGKGKLILDKDQRPTVWIDYPGQDLMVTPDMRVPIQIEAEDDHGVARVDVHRVVNELGDSPRRRDIAQPEPKVQDRLVMDLEDLGVRPGDTITYYAVAYDNEPGTPNYGESGSFTLKVVTSEEYQQALKQQREAADLSRETKDIVSAAQDLADRQEQLAQEMERLQREMARNPNAPGLKEKMAQARKDQKALQEETRKTAQQLQDYANSPAATELEKALKKKLAEMAQAMAKAANGPMQAAQSDNPQQAAAASREAAKQMGAINKQMQAQIAKAIEHLEKILPLFADLERFKELTDLQGQLVLKAREFQQKAATDPVAKQRLEQLASAQNQIQQALKQLVEDLRQHADDAQANFPKAARTARKIADEIGQRQIPDMMQEGQDRVRQWDGPGAFVKAEAAFRQMHAMIKECEGGQGSCQGELDIALSKALGQSGLGNSLAQLGQGMGMGNGTGQGGMGLGMGGNQMGPGGQRGGGFAMKGAKAYTPSFQSMHGSGGGKKERKQNQIAGQPAALSPGDVEIVKNPAVKPLKAGDQDANRYPAEYRKLISKYFESVAEGK